MGVFLHLRSILAIPERKVTSRLEEGQFLDYVGISGLRWNFWIMLELLDYVGFTDWLSDPDVVSPTPDV